jgi:hypothetical protein
LELCFIGRIEKIQMVRTRLFERKGLSWMAEYKLLIDRSLTYGKRF